MQLWNTIDWETRQSLLFVALASVILVAGVVLLLKARRTKRLSRAFHLLKKKSDEGQKQLQLCKDEKSLIRADVQKLKRQKNELKIVCEDLKYEHERLQTENQKLKIEQRRTKVQLEKAYHEVENLKDQIIGLKAKPFFPQMLEKGAFYAGNENRLHAAIEKLENLIDRVLDNDLKPK